MTAFKRSATNDKHENSLFSIHDLVGTKRLSRLKLQFSHLKKHKFRHSFSDTVIPMSCTAITFLLKDRSSSIAFR